MLTKEQIAELKVRRVNGRWLAGWYDERFSLSAASGDLGFYGDTPEEAVKALMDYVVDNVTGETEETRN